MNGPASFTVVIRSAGERTEATCRALVLAQGVPDSDVVEVNAHPFSETMRRAFKAGIERGHPWTFCVDADVLLRPGSLAYLLDFASCLPPSAAGGQPYFLDKLFGGERSGGVHIYRTDVLELASTLIPDEGRDVRPERHTISALEARARPWMRFRQIVGIHDFHQRYEDIYRKCFVHATKHAIHLPMFVDYWRSEMHSDDDFRVALAGLAAGIIHGGPVLIDASDETYALGFDALGISEKPPLDATEISPDEIERLVTGWVHPAQYLAAFPTRQGMDLLSAWESALMAAEGFLRAVRVEGIAGASKRACERLLKS